MSRSAERTRIHLLDSKPEELKLLTAALRSENFHLSIAFDGPEGLRRVNAARPDMVLLDAHLSGMDGFAVCRRLKAAPETANIPLIFVTAASRLQDRLEGLRSGAVDYILKPFHPAEVLARILVHLSIAASRKAAKEPPQDAQAPWGPAAERADRVLVEAAVRIIGLDLAHPPTLGEIAHQVGTHEKRLSSAFRNCRGQTVFEFVRAARLAEVQRLLGKTPISIEDIAHQTGFSSGANLATAFRDEFGVTPTAFRRSQQGSTPSRIL
jgi:DNA-binding response OmpR family regulator